MQSAALFLLASSMGVLFGWQPMPDGSPRYEYVVQLDPELLAALEAGESIPISSDIPEDIRPIGRIRIVVGREPLPRTRLTTALKPLLKKSREGLLETQLRVAPVESTPSGRYNGASPQAILPPQDTQGLAGSLRGATQSLGNQIRDVGQSVRTDAQQMFGRAGNDASSGVAGQIGKTVEQLQQGIQRGIQQGIGQGAEPFRQAAQQTGQHLRNAAENLGQQAREAVDQFGQPQRERSILGARENNSQTILPPGSSPPPQQQFTGNQSGANGHQHDQPASSRRDTGSSRRDNWEASPWNNPAPSTPGNRASGNMASGNNPPPARAATASPGGFSTPWPAQPQNEYRNQASQPHRQSHQQSGPPQILPNKTAHDRFDLANHPPASQPAATDNARGHYPPNDKWPSSDPRTRGPNFLGGNFNASPPSAGNDQHAHASAAPEIRRGMLEKPANAALLSTGRQPAMPPFSQAPERRSFESQSFERPSGASDFGWDNTSRRVAERSPSRSEDPNRTVFPLLLSWVLLSGSGAGNLYLLWSFWDVRNKYRGLVYNARNSGGRYSGN